MAIASAFVLIPMFVLIPRAAEGGPREHDEVLGDLGTLRREACWCPAPREAGHTKGKIVPSLAG